MKTMKVVVFGANSMMGDIRQTRNTPAVTIVAAWISADTGVGPSIASGSQVCRNSCADFPIAPTNSRNGDQLRRVPACPEEGDLRLRDLGRGGEDVGEVDGIDQEEHREDAEREAEVPHPVHDERLHRRRVGRGLAVVEPDQQVGGEAHPLPAEEQLHEVVRRHQHQHREGEERQIGEEARPVAFAFAEVVVMRHVAERIEVHERRDGGDDDQHDRRQPVEPDGPVGRQADPLSIQRRIGICCVVAVEVDEHDPRQHAGQEQQARRRPLRRRLADELPAEPADQRAHERREEDDRFHWVSPSSR